MVDKVVNFDSAMCSCNGESGMILVAGRNSAGLSNDECEEVWGQCKDEEISSTECNYDDEYSPFYDRDVSSTTTWFYRATFLLAFCKDYVDMIKCLGGNEGVAKI